jgi:hypothetical protein
LRWRSEPATNSVKANDSKHTNELVFGCMLKDVFLIHGAGNGIHNAVQMSDLNEQTFCPLLGAPFQGGKWPAVSHETI